MKKTAAPAATQAQVRTKMVRDSFALPAAEYAALCVIKQACLAEGLTVKKSTLLRAGVAYLASMDAAALKQALDALPPMHRGRPRNRK